MGTAVLEKKLSATKPPKATRARPSVSKPHMTQMNVRIETDLKEKGDRAFERIGSSPSEMVRALWRYASRHANDPEALRHLMEELEGEGAAENSISETPRQGWEIMEEAYRALGITPKPLPEDDEERMAYYTKLKEEAYLERQRERGLL